MLRPSGHGFAASARKRYAHAGNALALLLAAAPAVANEYVNDPLTSPAAGVGVRGGSFSAGGWTTTANNDTLWWTIPDALPAGTIEFTMQGLSLATNLTDGDNDLFTFYQAPTDAVEPINYNPQFRNNDMRTFLRVFGSTGGAPIAGAMKVEMTRCMVGPPYYNNACPADCTGLDGIAYARGQMSDAGWDAGTAYRMRIAWGNGQLQYFRNDELMGTVGYDGTYAPSPMTVHIGSPRNGAGGSMPVGLTFRDVRISGTPGAQTQVCNAPPPPPPPTPPTTGCPDGTFGAAADTTAASWEPGVFGDVTDLNVEGDGAAPDSIVYVKFTASGPVTQAILQLHTQNDAHAHGGSGIVCAVAPGATVDEQSLTWQNAPAPTMMCVGPARTVDPDTEVEWDVTALLADDASRPLALVSTDADGAHYVSRETGGCTQGPRLVVTAPPGDPPPDQPPPDPPPPDQPPDQPPDVPPDVPPDHGSDPGAGHGPHATPAAVEACGCTGAPATSTPTVALALLALRAAALSVRRRRPRS